MLDIDAIEAQVDQDAVNFIRAGYAGASLHFKVEAGNVATFRECVWAIGGYNEFDPATVGDLLGDVLPECASGAVQIGREYSPVIYASIPFHTHQTMAHDVACEDGRPFTEDERETLAARVMAAGKMAGADECDVILIPRDAGSGLGGRVGAVRLWWD
jgi:hypothetical protein